MIRMSNWLTRAAAAAILLMVPMAHVQAAPSAIDLNTCLNTDVNPDADACRGYIDKANDKINPSLFVNDFNGGLFGGGWTFDSKIEEQNGGTVKEGNGNIEITTPVPDSTGTWLIKNIADLISDNDDAMIVLKGGNGFNAFLYEMFGTEIENGTWTMYAGANRELKDISHISLYLRGDGRDIPLPATIGLLGIGLIGLGAGLARRRRT